MISRIGCEGLKPSDSQLKKFGDAREIPVRAFHISVSEISRKGIDDLIHCHSLLVPLEESATSECMPIMPISA